MFFENMKIIILNSKLLSNLKKLTICVWPYGQNVTLIYAVQIKKLMIYI